MTSALHRYHSATQEQIRANAEVVRHVVRWLNQYISEQHDAATGDVKVLRNDR